MLHARLDDIDLDALTDAEQIELLDHLEWLDRYERGRQFFRFFPDETTTHPDGTTFHARRLYPKHIEFFAVGKTYRERCFLAGNRVGKTIAGAYETTSHLTGLYADWWEGRRFAKPIRAWAAGATNETTRDIVQTTLLGEVSFADGRKGFTGTGMIPADCIGPITWKQGVQDLADTVKIKHPRGWSSLGFKSYQQGRKSFEGTAQHLIWLDEEVPLDVYGECLIRTATTNGIVVITFTPLAGLTPTVMQFMPGEHRPDEV